MFWTPVRMFGSAVLLGGVGFFAYIFVDAWANKHIAYDADEFAAWSMFAMCVGTWCMLIGGDHTKG